MIRPDVANVAGDGKQTEDTSTKAPANDKSVAGNTAKAPAKSAKALRTISEAADLLDVPQHVLRFWETKFTQIKPMKRNGGRRYYRPDDIEVLLEIKNLLYRQGYTIKGAKKALDDKGAGKPVSAPQTASAKTAPTTEKKITVKAIKKELQSIRDLLQSTSS